MRSAPPLVVLACLAPVFLPLAAHAATSVRAELRLLAFQPDQAIDEAFAHDPTAPPPAANAAPAAGVKVPVKSYLNHEFAAVVLTGRRIVLTTRPERESLTRADELLGEATLPDGVRSAILLCLPAAPGDKARFRILVIDDSKRAFPAGTFRVSNLSSQPVRIVLEDKTYQFKPGEIQLITDPPVRAGNQSGMKAFAFHDDVWQRIGSASGPIPAKTVSCQSSSPTPAPARSNCAPTTTCRPASPRPNGVPASAGESISP